MVVTVDVPAHVHVPAPVPAAAEPAAPPKTFTILTLSWRISKSESDTTHLSR